MPVPHNVHVLTYQVPCSLFSRTEIFLSSVLLVLIYSHVIANVVVLKLFNTIFNFEFMFKP